MTQTKPISLLAAALGLVAGLFALSLQPAEAGGFGEQVSGNFTDTAIDTNGDGMQANAWSGQARDNGSPSYEGLVEVAFEPTGECDPGQGEGTVVEYSIVRRYGSGDLLFSRLVDGSFCFDPTTGLASLTINAQFVGGTGQHAGATGTYTADYTVRGLVQDQSQAIVHGAFWGETSG